MLPRSDDRAHLEGYQRLAIAVLAAGMRDPRDAAGFPETVAFRYWSVVAGLDPDALRREFARRGAPGQQIRADRRETPDEESA